MYGPEWVMGVDGGETVTTGFKGLGGQAAKRCGPSRTKHSHAQLQNAASQSGRLEWSL